MALPAVRAGTAACARSPPLHVPVAAATLLGRVHRRVVQRLAGRVRARRVRAPVALPRRPGRGGVACSAHAHHPTRAMCVRDHVRGEMMVVRWRWGVRSGCDCGALGRCRRDGACGLGLVARFAHD